MKGLGRCGAGAQRRRNRALGGAGQRIIADTLGWPRLQSAARLLESPVVPGIVVP
jgi:hypothetical protein